jgi:RNA polymerase sigma factor (TIGR02999 family)
MTRESEPSEVDMLLRALEADPESRDSSLWPEVYEGLRKIAHSARRSVPRHRGPQTTTLVHEAFLRLSKLVPQIASEKHYYVLAARAMRHVMIDRLRSENRQKRKAEGVRVRLDDILDDLQHRDVDLLALDEALTRLAEFDERKARVVELRFFAGLSIPRTAEVLGIGTATVERDWSLARAWLRRELHAGLDPGATGITEPPAMNPERWARVEDVFHRAMALPEVERDAFVRDACSADESLLDEVYSLLVAAEEGATFIDRPALDETLTPRGAAERPDPLIGARIGAFELVARLGVGGMGTVYTGQRADGRFDQRVAIKIMRADLLGASAPRRFEQERRTLARLEHPGIARLFDGGALPDGRPYLVMEFVEGERLDRHCHAQGLDLEARLRLMLQVIDAVQYAHQNLVIHRDLKPSNILVDPGGTARVIDFGIALPLYLASSQTMVTGGRDLLGTLAYMSPEQCERGAGAAVDVRSDVYALGVLLYELLTGRQPHDVSTGSLAGAIRTITEVQPQRPAALDPRLRGDLETIILKALEKDPARRYQSAGELAEDIRAHLESRPIRARPASPAYLLTKYLRRHRSQLGAAVAAGAAVLTLVAIGVMWFVVLPRWSQRSYHEARSRVLSWELQEAIVSAVCFRGAADSRSIESRHYLQYASTLPHYARANRFGLLDEVGRGEYEAMRAVEALYKLQPGDWGSAWPTDVRDGIRRIVLADDLDGAIEGAPTADLRDAGLVLMLLTRYEAAVRVLQRHETRVTNDPLIEAMLGELYLALEKPELAYPRVRAGYDAFPGSRMITLSLAEAAIGVGDLARAELLLNEAEQMPNPDRLSRLGRVRAMFLAAAGREQEAHDAFVIATAVTTQNGLSFSINPIACYHRARFEESRGFFVNGAQFALLGLQMDPRAGSLEREPAINLELFVRLLREGILIWDEQALRDQLEITCESNEQYHWKVSPVPTDTPDPMFLPVSLQPWLLVYLRVRAELLTRPPRIAVTPEDEARIEAEQRSWREPDELTELADLLDVTNEPLWAALRHETCPGRDELIEACIDRDADRARVAREEILTSAVAVEP